MLERWLDMQDSIDQIKPVDNAAYEACIARFDNVAKPVGSLGQLEELLARIAAISGTHDVDISKKCVLTFCADNGVLAQGVATSDHTVTTAVASMLGIGKGCVCTMAKTVGADAFIIDVGMVDTLDTLLPHKVMVGTNDMTLGPAMSVEDAKKAIQLGIDLVKEKKDEGYKLIATGEAGIGNTTTTSAMASVFLGLSVEEVVGRGAGISDEGLERKKAAIIKAIEINNPDANDPIDLLAKIGGLDIAAMTGAFLGGAIHGVPIIMDGVISAVSALTAVSINPLVRDYIIPSHVSAEPAGILLQQKLGFSPILNAGMRLGEGTGAVALFPLLDMAKDVYYDAATFEDIAVYDYTRS
ncbi:MAG: nicotinate-nucleotide--dimethylbenzimidazole phosphoribosyltransferase [Actinobacteria bacterium]|nr:nicotinate-nucleotide--dimethylbenzimidazole phosphoribosyltransferase [Actinomycetota bacterium]